MTYFMSSVDGRWKDWRSRDRSNASHRLMKDSAVESENKIVKFSAEGSHRQRQNSIGDDDPSDLNESCFSSDSEYTLSDHINKTTDDTSDDGQDAMSD